MKKIGLTGSYAMGKSTIADLFAKLGMQVICADKLVDEIYANDFELKEFLQHKYPRFIQSGIIDKMQISKAAFADENLLKDLEAIIHPKVMQKRDELIVGFQQQNCILFDIPLLFETGKEAEFDIIIVAYCSRKTQTLRAKQRNISLEKLDLIRQSQMSVQDKISKADITIDTDQHLEKIQQQIKKIYEDICAR